MVDTNGTLAPVETTEQERKRLQRAADKAAREAQAEAERLSRQTDKFLLLRTRAMTFAKQSTSIGIETALGKVNTKLDKMPATATVAAIQDVGDKHGIKCAFKWKAGIQDADCAHTLADSASADGQDARDFLGEMLAK